MSYELHIHTSDTASTAQTLLEVYNLIGSLTLDNLVGEHDIDISINRAPSTENEALITQDAPRP